MEKSIDLEEFRAEIVGAITKHFDRRIGAFEKRMDILASEKSVQEGFAAIAERFDRTDRTIAAIQRIPTRTPYDHPYYAAMGIRSVS